MTLRPSRYLLILVLFISACSGFAQTSPEGGYDFTDDEGLVLTQPEGFVFTEDEADALPQEPGMDFSDDEASRLAAGEDGVIPPIGFTTWSITHAQGTISCPQGVNIRIAASPPETVVINTGVEGAGLELSGLEGGPPLFFLQMGAGPGGSVYTAEYEATTPTGTVTISYEVLFVSNADNGVADFLMGEITSEPEGCSVARSFSGTRQD